MDFDNSGNPRFAHVERGPQGTSVVCQVTQLARPGWGWGAGFEPGGLAVEPVLLAHRAGPPLQGAPFPLQEHRRHAVAGRDLSAALSTPSGLLTKLHSGHINTGTISLIIVAFRSQAPVWSCAPRFMLPTSIRANGKGLH